MKFEIKNRFTGDVQFTAEIDATDETPCSIKIGLAVKWAIKSRANLAYAYLAEANLTDANLGGAYLAYANLTDANLKGANLKGANLAYAYLTDAHLKGANLKGAYLTDANLTGAYLANADLADANLKGAYLAYADLAYANLTDAHLKGAKWHDGILITRAPIQIYNLPGGWLVTVFEHHMQIGCKLHTHDEWAAFTDKQIIEMGGCADAAEIWKINKGWLLAACRAHADETDAQEDA